VRFLFDPSRSHPFGQFLNKNNLDLIKRQAKKLSTESFPNYQVNALDFRLSTPMEKKFVTAFTPKDNKIRRQSMRPLFQGTTEKLQSKE
jgi:hypothetical protein